MADTTPNDQGTVLTPATQHIMQQIERMSREQRAELHSMLLDQEWQNAMEKLAAQEEHRREMERQKNRPRDDYGIPEWDDR